MTTNVAARIALTAVLLSSCVPFVSAGSAIDNPGERAALYWSGGEPSSADPVDFDAFVHHAVFTPVQAWMVVNYLSASGDYQGELAESYMVSPDSTTYVFTLRQGLTYETGEPITTKDIVDSWTRLVRALKAKGSSADAFVGLVGYDEFPDKAPSLAGLSYDARTVWVRFAKPRPGFLDDLTFGIYALAHPALYDHQTGRWLDPKKVIASGPYRVVEWNDKHLRLALREDFPPQLRHPHAFPAIEIRWDNSSLKKADLMWSTWENKPDAPGYEFQGGEAPGVDYLQCESWKDPASPLASVAVRRRLRAAFYEEMAKGGESFDKSFYPLSMKGVRDPDAELSPADAAAAIPSGARLRFRELNEPATRHGIALRDALARAARRLGFKFENVKKYPEEWDDWASTGAIAAKIDIRWAGTRVDVDDPVGEAHFMFETRNGVCLPDPTGKAAGLFEKPGVGAQDFNQLLWDDAIIWTFRHTHGGWWRKPDVDFSLFNSTVSVPAMQMMGWKQ